MRFLFLVLFGAAFSHAAIVAQASCPTPWEIPSWDFDGHPAGEKMYGTGGSEAGVIYTAGSVSAGCTAALLSGVAASIGAGITIDAGSATGGVGFTVPDGFAFPVELLVAGSVSGELWATTPGPVRPGFLTLSGTGSSCDFHYACLPNEHVSVAGHEVPGDGSTESGVPVTLGVPFRVTIDGLWGAFGAGDGPPAGAWSAVDAHWAFSELNGKAVAVTFLLTPEPATFLPCMGALLMGAVFGIRRDQWWRRRGSNPHVQ